MTGRRMMRVMKMAAAGAILLQASGCAFLAANEVIQTILLGITAAGSVAILQNI